MIWHNDIEHNVIQHSDPQQNGIQNNTSHQNDTQENDLHLLQLANCFASWHYGECHSVECCCAERRGADAEDDGSKKGKNE